MYFLFEMRQYFHLLFQRENFISQVANSSDFAAKALNLAQQAIIIKRQFVRRRNMALVTALQGRLTMSDESSLRVYESLNR